MIISLFILLFIVGIIIFLIGEEKESIVYQMISMIVFIVLFAQSLYISIPFIAVTNATNYTVSEHTYSEYGLSILCLIFVFADILLVIIEFMDRRKKRIGPYIPGG